MINSDAEDSDSDDDISEEDEEEEQISGPFATMTARPPIDIEQLARYIIL